MSLAERMYSRPVRASRNATNAPGSLGNPRPSASERRTLRFDPSAALTAYRADILDRAARRAEPGVVEDERTLAAGAVRVRQDGLVDVPAAVHQVVEQEVVRLREPGARWRSGKISRSCRSTSHGSGRSSSIARRNSIPYFSPKPSTWPWPSIGRPGSVARTVATPKYLSPLPNCSSAGLLVRVAHEVDVALEDLRGRTRGCR